MKQAATEKLMVLGIDGMDPRLTKQYILEGRMPHTAELIARGSARADLSMLGGHPTVTPPMWTTLATGTWPVVHGITGFSRRSPGKLGVSEYGLDSRLCKAEPLWNVFAEAGKKTLVIHWPGSSWPPTSDSPNLHVIDGTQPGTVNMGVAQIEAEFVLAASEQTEAVTFKAKAAADSNVPCVITDLEVAENGAPDFLSRSAEQGENLTLILKENDGQGALGEAPFDLVFSQIKPAVGWANAPQGAKEFVMLFSQGLIRRVALLVPNAAGVYDRVALYNHKQDAEPIAILEKDVFTANILGQAWKNDAYYDVVRNMRVLELAPDGSRVKMWISAAMDIHNDSVWHPKRLYQDVVEHVGYPCSEAMLGAFDKRMVTDCMLANWYTTATWQAKAILHLIESENLDVVFSHYHAVDLEMHMFIKHMAERPFNKHPVEVARKWAEDVYIQTDYYLGQFLHLLDEGWTILIFSDHGQVAPAHEIPALMDLNGVAIPLMEEMGYTIPIRNENGDVIGIDWTKTKAVMQREGHLYLNIKGREKHVLPDGRVVDGIVEPKDQYELEEEIMTKLYALKSPETGHRIVSVALRNRDAVLLGQGGPEAGDIIVWLTEGHNFDHDDCLSTTLGEGDTSVSPLFIAAGKGLKQGYETQRIIRQVDFAATVAILGGVRMPRQCEGAPVYPIFAEEV